MKKLNYTRVFTAIILLLLVGTSIGSFMLARYARQYDDACIKAGGFPAHGAGIDLCLKPEVLLGTDNG